MKKMKKYRIAENFERGTRVEQTEGLEFNSEKKKKLGGKTAYGVETNGTGQRAKKM